MADSRVQETALTIITETGGDMSKLATVVDLLNGLVSEIFTEHQQRRSEPPEKPAS